MTVELPNDVPGLPLEEGLLTAGRRSTHRGRTESRERVAPDLVGLEMLAAYAAARSAGVRVSVAVRESKIGPFGLVLEQSPPAGTRLRAGSRVNILVTGRLHVAIPDVRGLSYVDAATQLRHLGLVPVAVEQRPSRTVTAGHVMGTVPRPGSLVAHGSSVALTVAKAPIRRRATRAASQAPIDAAGS